MIDGGPEEFALELDAEGYVRIRHVLYYILNATTRPRGVHGGNAPRKALRTMSD